MVKNNLYLINKSKEINLKRILIVVSLISFFFLWDIKLSLYKSFTFSLREIFYLLSIFLLINYKKIFNKKDLKFFLFFFIFFFYNLLIFDTKFSLLDFRYNILPMSFLFLIFFICQKFIENIIDNLDVAFLIFIYLLIFSFLFSDIILLHPNEKIRVCGIINFKIINQLIFLEPSHLGMVLIPFYYFIFKLGKINKLNEIILSIFLIFIFIFYYSLTLLISIILCFLTMLILDHRFFFKNKIFFFTQFFILIMPIFFNSCFYKMTNSLTNIENLKTNKSNLIFDSKIDYNSNDNLDLNLDLDLNKSSYLEIEEILSKLILSMSKDNNYKLINQKILKINKIIEIQDNRINDPNFRKNELILKKTKKYRKELDRIRKIFSKKKISLIQDHNTAVEMNHIIRENVNLFLTESKSHINDHSSAVLLNALNVALLSIKDKPFGWGFNNYQRAFNKYMLEEITPPFPEIYYLNYNDGSNNFIKLFVEFGLFSILIFINIVVFIFNKKIPVSLRILFGGIIITQMVRAAGYFNGGFALCLILTFVLNLQFYKNETR